MVADCGLQRFINSNRDAYNVDKNKHNKHIFIMFKFLKNVLLPTRKSIILLVLRLTLLKKASPNTKVPTIVHVMIWMKLRLLRGFCSSSMIGVSRAASQASLALQHIRFLNPVF